MRFRNYRKLIILVLLAVLFILSSCSPKTSTQIEQEFDEHNRVIKEITFVQGEMIGTTTYQYGTDGNCSRKDHYDKDNVLTHYTTFVYNSKGQVTRETLYQGNKMFTETTIQYNEDGLCSRSDTLTYEGGETYCLFFYDENNKLTDIKQYSVDSNEDHLRFWDKYNQAGYKVSSSHYVASGALDYTKVWEYDGNGRMKTLTEYDSNNNIKYITKYDKNGNVKSTKKY